MKKSVIYALVAAVLLISFSIGVYAKIKNDTIESLEKEYIHLQEIDEQMTENESALEYSKLFAKISDGNKAWKSEYANLVRNITNDSLEFDDDAVFEIAGDLAEYYRNMSEGNDDFGIHGIKIIKSDLNELSLVIDYIDVRAYSVRLMESDEPDYSSEFPSEYDGSLGKYRVEIMFYDSLPSRKFVDQYPISDVHELIDVPEEYKGIFKISTDYTVNHGFVVYIGSDEILAVEEQEFTKPGRLIGSIEIKFDTIQNQ